MCPKRHLAVRKYAIPWICLISVLLVNPVNAETRISPKIIGGKEVEPGDWPFMIALLDAKIEDRFLAQNCGGSLIHPYWVLTAAHCLDGLWASDIDVLVGSHDLNATSVGRRIGVAEIIVHPDYMPTSFTADIALLRLKEPVNDFPPIKIVDATSLIEPGTLTKALGWGDLTGEGDYASILQEVDLPIADIELIAGELGFQPAVTDAMLVAGTAQADKNTTKGDSGGPLIVKDPDSGEWYLAGITSYGFPDSNTSFGIYTKASAFRDEVLGLIYPDYLAWEHQSGVVGMNRDPDGDSWSNFMEYAFSGNPLQPEDNLLGLSNTRGTAPGSEFLAIVSWANWSVEDLDIKWQSADSLNGPWQTIPEDSLQFFSMGTGTGLYAQYNQPMKNHTPETFHRVTVVPTSDYLTPVRNLTAFRPATGALTAEDPSHPFFVERRTKTYHLRDLPVGQTAVITGRSTLFDVRLELLDANSGEIIMVAEDGTVRGFNTTDERLEVTGTSESEFHLRVTSETDGGLGDFRIGGFNTTYINGVLPGIDLNDTISGALHNTDPVDPTWYPDIYYSQDYRLDSAEYGWIKVMLDSNAFDAYLAIVDAESGLPFYSDDDSGEGTNAVLEFEFIEGLTYLVRVSSAEIKGTGGFTLSIAPGTPLQKLSVPGSIAGSLSNTDREDPNYPGTYIDEFDLENISPGQMVNVSMASTVLDTYLFLIDAETGAIIQENDDASDYSTNAGFTFEVEANRSYRIRASSFSSGEIGPYTLSAD